LYIFAYKIIVIYSSKITRFTKITIIARITKITIIARITKIIIIAKTSIVTKKCPN